MARMTHDVCMWNFGHNCTPRGRICVCASELQTELIIEIAKLGKIKSCFDSVVESRLTQYLLR